MIVPYKLEFVDSSNLEASREWDEFVTSSPRGHFICLTTWLGSFATYSIPYNVILARRESDRVILGGLATLTFGNRFLGWIVSPFGPIVSVGNEWIAGELLRAGEDFARTHRIATFQVNTPVRRQSESGELAEETGALYNPIPFESRFVYPNAEPVFDGGVSQVLFVKFPEADSENLLVERLVATYPKSTRKNLRKAWKYDVEVLECTTPKQIEDAYSVIRASGVRKGYSTRDWVDIGPVIQRQIRCGHGILFLARKDGEHLGTLYCGVAGNRLQTVMQGTERTNPDMKIGLLLHSHAFIEAWRRGLSGCDLSADGNEGIRRFKESLAPLRVTFEPPQVLVFSPVRSRLLTVVRPFLARNKRWISRILRHFAHEKKTAALPP